MFPIGSNRHGRPASYDFISVGALRQMPEFFMAGANGVSLSGYCFSSGTALLQGFRAGVPKGEKKRKKFFDNRPGMLNIKHCLMYARAYITLRCVVFTTGDAKIVGNEISGHLTCGL